MIAFFNQFRQRSTVLEDMDDLDLDTPELVAALDFIENVNIWLGGHAVILSGFRESLQHLPADEPITVLDLGCGGGDTLRELVAAFPAPRLKWIGWDANPAIIRYAEEKSRGLPITYDVQNIFDAPLPAVEGKTVVLCSLFLHHFTNQEIQLLLEKWKTADLILINDLHRHWGAYVLFQALCTVIRAPIMAREDGAISIRKGFKKKDLTAFAKTSSSDQWFLRWKWIFRYQLVLINQH